MRISDWSSDVCSSDLSRKQFATLYRTPLERYAELVQVFPASEAHHHAYPGGMLDHGLEIVAYSLKLRQSHLLPVGASPEDQAAQSERSEEHTSELQSLMRISYAVLCLKKKKT